MSGYRNNKRWRKKHRIQFNNWKREYNQSSQASARNSGSEWSSVEMAAIVATDRLSDRELSRKLGRSIQAIQVRRCKIRQGKIRI